MSEEFYRSVQPLLASTQPEEIRRGLELVRKEIARIGSAEARPLFEMVSAIFYIDPLDRPDLVPLLDEAISLVVGFGAWVIPPLLEKLDSGDLKAQMAAAQALGRIGADAIQPLITHYQAAPDPSHRAFVLFALGKIKSPRVVQAVGLALAAAQAPDLELRDTATRALGKLAESIPPAELPEDTRLEIVRQLQANLADPNPVIRAKAIRSLGKLARYGHLNAAEREQLKATCQLILGTDDQFDWDRAYIVRKQAEEALGYA